MQGLIYIYKNVALLIIQPLCRANAKYENVMHKVPLYKFGYKV
jgi:hypothetical protein